MTSKKGKLNLYKSEHQHEAEADGNSCSTASEGPVKAATSAKEPVEPVAVDKFKGRACIITLGCAKNQVDSEVMLGVLQRSGFEIVSQITEADVAVVNTCGFLESSTRESLDAILEAADFRKQGRLRKLIVSGCLVERYKSELAASLPEVDSFITTDDLLKVAAVAEGEDQTILDDAARPYFLYDETMPRVLATKPHTAYVKVSEGCDRPCTFCIIPRIRGAQRSREISSIVREVEALCNQGVREINLVAQDLTSFGKDRSKGKGIDIDGTPQDTAAQNGGDLSALLRALDANGSAEWIRLLYAYPVGIERELLRTIVELPSVCNYLDLPLQHSSEKVLQRMKRPIGRYAPRRLIPFIRQEAPEIELRTTFIVGFPGETDEDIADLESFILEGHFSNVGVFTYSREAGTPSYDLDGHISEAEKNKRRARIMKAQQEVVQRRLGQRMGATIPVLLEGTHEDTDLLLVGRASFQAPEVDGVVIINDKVMEGALNPGSLYSVEITGVAGYDLLGRVVGESSFSRNLGSQVAGSA